MEKRAKQRFFLNQGTLNRKVLSAGFGRPVVYAFADVSACSPDGLSVIALDKKHEVSCLSRSASSNVAKWKLLPERRVI